MPNQPSSSPTEARVYFRERTGVPVSPASPNRTAGKREAAVQREVTRIALSGARGFALTGSGAIREHGLIERPTEDVDLFTTSQDVAAFGAAVEQVSGRLRRSGFGVEEVRRAPQCARLHVTTSDGLQLDVDLGVDWRQDAPVFLDVGPVLSLPDAVGNKVSALYGRGEARASGPQGADRGMPEHLRANFPRAVTDAARQPPSSSPEARPSTHARTPDRGVER